MAASFGCGSSVIVDSSSGGGGPSGSRSTTSAGAGASTTASGTGTVAPSSATSSGSGGGTPVELASGLVRPNHLVVDATSVYWLTMSGVEKVPIHGGTKVTLGSVPPANAPLSLALDGTSIYWTSGDLVMRTPIGGGPPATLASSAPTGAIAVDAVYAYWTNQAGLAFKVSINGGNPVTLYQPPSEEFAQTLAIDATSLYWTVSNSPGGKVVRLPLSGAAPIVLNYTISPPHELVIDETHVYWADSTGDILGVPKSGGNPITLVAGQPGIEYLAIDDANIYWSDPNNEIMKVPIGGGTPTPVVTGQQNILSVAVDAANVYWTTGFSLGTPDGAVWKVAK